MPFSSGIFQRLYSWVTDRDNAIKILASRMDGEFNNYADAINDIVDGTQPFTGPVKAPYGTVASPGFQFDGDSNTGVARAGADTVALVTGGVARLTANTTALTSTLPINAPVGAAATPSVNFTSTDGFWSPGAGIVALSLGGVEKLRWTTSGASGAIAAYTLPPSKLINTDMQIDQRNGYTTFPWPFGFPCDRWEARASGGTFAVTVNRAANTLSYGGHYPKTVIGLTPDGALSTDYARWQQRIESARTYSGLTITIFGWGRRVGAAGNISVSAVQNFGTGGSPSSSVTINATAASTVNIGTSVGAWKATLVIPSVVGKTFGSNDNDYLEIRVWISAGSSLNAEANSIGIQGTEVFLWGIHDRPGDVPIEAINFYQPPDPQTELARCQRYFAVLETPMKVSAAAPQIGQTALPVTMRAVPALSNIIFSAGTGATFSASKTSIIQTNLHSQAANVTSITASAEL